MRTIFLALVVTMGLTAATAGAALAEEARGVEIRNINTATRVIGCSRYLPECAGATSVRTGLVVVDVATRRLRVGRVGLVGMFQGAARPEGALLSSQMIAGGGARVALGSAWVQGGVGFAARQVAPGPKTITTTHALTIASPAVLLGVGARTRALDLPVEISLDLGTGLTRPDDDLGPDQRGRTYQVTANVLVAGM